MTRYSSTSDIASSTFRKKGLVSLLPNGCGSIRCVLAALTILCLPPCSRAAGGGPPLPTVLDHVAQQVSNFWNYFPAVTCTEQVTQDKLRDKGKPLFEQRTSYDYLILLHSSGTEISVDESRIEKGQKATKGKASLLLTDGFAILALIFHPIYQSSFQFKELADETQDGRRLIRIEFHHVAGSPSPSVLRLHEREYPLQWQGVAWIDADTYAVVRIQAGLGDSMQEVGLLELNADVTYSTTPFNGTGVAYWLPSRAVIEAATKRQHWMNTHVFSDYRRFNVETEVKTGTPQ